MSVPGGRGSAAEKTATRTETGDSGPDLLKLGRRAESQNLAQPPKPDPDLLKLGRHVESANPGQPLEPGPALLKLGRRVESANPGEPPEAAEVAPAPRRPGKKARRVGEENYKDVSNQ